MKKRIYYCDGCGNEIVSSIFKIDAFTAHSGVLNEIGEMGVAYRMISPLADDCPSKAPLEFCSAHCTKQWLCQAVDWGHDRISPKVHS